MDRRADESAPTHPLFLAHFTTGEADTSEGICLVHHLSFECDYQSHRSVFRLRGNVRAHISCSLPSDGEIYEGINSNCVISEEVQSKGLNTGTVGSE